VLDTNVKAAFAFSHEAIAAFRGQAIGVDDADDDQDARRGSTGTGGKRGTLLFTGATASLRGNTTTSALSAAKFALRSLSQSLNKEFGKENIHVCAPSPLFALLSMLPTNQSFPGGARMSTFFDHFSFSLSSRLLTISRTHSKVVIDGGTPISYTVTPP
jgi:NAD(P)-dependent dehydrogenase (short-subunit alcohol dehydrogenase family)